MNTRKDKVESDVTSFQKGNRIPIIIDGVSYDSIADASRRLGVTRATIERYIRDGKKKPLSEMQKVVIATVSCIFLAIVIIVLIVLVTSQSKTPDSHSTVFDKKSVSSTKKDTATSDDTGYRQIIKGDLSSFEGQYSDDKLEKAIEDLGFTLYAYRPEDYYQNNTTVFPSIQKNAKTNDEWTYWSGSMHAQYKLDPDKLPQKKNDYYEVYFVGANSAAIEGQKMSLILVPPLVKAPDGTSSDDRRIFYGTNAGASYRQYHVEWWQEKNEIVEPTSYSVADITEKQLPLKYDGWQIEKVQGIGGIDKRSGKRLENIRRDDGTVNGFAQFPFYVEVDKLFIRSKPDVNAEVVGHVIKGDVVYGYLGEADGAKWVLVNIVSDNTKGYIRMINPENNAPLLTLFMGRIE